MECESGAAEQRNGPVSEFVCGGKWGNRGNRGVSECGFEGKLLDEVGGAGGDPDADFGGKTVRGRQTRRNVASSRLLER